MIELLELAAGWFYDPYVYWGVPLLLALALEVASRLRWRGRPRR